MKLFGWVFIILALGAAALDGLAWRDGADPEQTRNRFCQVAAFEFRSFYCALDDAYAGTPIAIKSLVQNQIEEPLGLIEYEDSIYFNYVQPALEAPAAPWLAGIGAALLLLSLMLRSLFRRRDRRAHI